MNGFPPILREAWEESAENAEEIATEAEREANALEP